METYGTIPFTESWFSLGKRVLAATWQEVQTLKAPLLIGAAVCSLAYLLLLMPLHSLSPENVGRSMGMDWQRMERMRDTMGENPEEVQRMAQDMQQALGNANPRAIVQNIFSGVTGGLTYVVLSMVLAMGFHAISTSYYLIVFVRKIQNPQVALAYAASVALSLLGVWFLSFVRTFAWVFPPFSFILGLIWGPRFVFAPYIFLTETLGINDSVTASYERTRGRWSLIVGALFVTGFTVFLLSAILGGIAGNIVKEISPLMAQWVRLFVQQATSVFGVGAVVQLAPYIVSKTSAKA